MTIKLANQSWILLPQKAVWIENTGTLLVSDLHLGKIEHFRIAGIGVPAAARRKTLDQLTQLCVRLQPERILFLGDLFHSVKNASFDEMQVFCDTFSDQKMMLITGNHDIMPAENYQKLGIDCMTEFMEGAFLFSHEPKNQVEEGLINVCGHIHPGIRLQGKGKQSLALPCFYMTESQFMLPAFGYFTGKFMVKAEPGCSIFVITEEKVLPIEFK